MKRIAIALMLFGAMFSANARQRTFSVVSPDMKNSAKVTTDAGGFRLEVSRNGSIVLNVNDIRMNVDERLWDGASGLKSVKKASRDNVLDYIVRRKYASIHESYNEIALIYSGYRFVVRAYQDGVAWRFEGTEGRRGKVTGDNAHFIFQPECQSYTLLTKELQNWFEENYTCTEIGSLPEDMLSIMPVMVRSGGCNVLLAEADVYNYSGAYLRPCGDGFESVRAYEDARHIEQ